MPPYKRNLELTPRDLRARLKRRFKDPRKQQLDPNAYNRELDKLMEDKKLLRSSNAKQKQHARLWRELMMPLNAEAKNVRTMLAYKGGEAERREALQGYLLVLETLHDRMYVDARRTFEGSTFTPAQLAKAQNKPNNGSHWTDWVPPSIKVKVQELFDEIPREGIRKKVPFERKVPAKLGKKLKVRLLERTLKELDVAKMKADRSALARDTDTNEIDTARIANIERAITWINEADDTTALPTTWSGFF